MRQWADQLNAGEQRGFSGSVITDVVNIGIGGSDLGPRLVTEALRPLPWQCRLSLRRQCRSRRPAEHVIELAGRNNAIQSSVLNPSAPRKP